jgi:hypothetical protein
MPCKGIEASPEFRPESGKLVIVVDPSDDCPCGEYDAVTGAFYDGDYFFDGETINYNSELIA